MKIMIRFIGIVSAYELIKKMNNIKTIEEIMLPAEPYLTDSATAKDAIMMMANAPIRDYSGHK